MKIEFDISDKTVRAIAVLCATWKESFSMVGVNWRSMADDLEKHIQGEDGDETDRPGT